MDTLVGLFDDLLEVSYLLAVFGEYGVDLDQVRGDPNHVVGSDWRWDSLLRAGAVARLSRRAPGWCSSPTVKEGSSHSSNSG